MSRNRQVQTIKLEKCPGYQAFSLRAGGTSGLPGRFEWDRLEMQKVSAHLKNILHIDAVQWKRAWLTVLLDSGRKVWKLPVTMLAPGLVWSGLLHHVPPRNPTLPHLPGLWVNFNFSLPLHFHSAPRPGISPTVGSVLAFKALLDRSSRVLAHGRALGAWFTGISALPTTPDMKLCTARVLGHLLLFHRPQHCFSFMESISYYKITCR